MTQSVWNAQPVTGDWNSADNWSPAEVPVDTALFTKSSQTEVGFSPSSGARIGQIRFADDASTYTFNFGACADPALIIAGEGVSNLSGRQQSFIVSATSSGYKDPQLKFVNSATAGEDIYYAAGPITKEGYGGGVICFCDNATAGSASFKAWTGAAAPPEHSTVGGEISFCDNASADTARFTIYGSLGTDGDTFGNVVFHDNATAANASFTNVGGTVSGGDGGNTQFYGDTTAAYANFHNWGGSHNKANGGDVAFDSNSSGGRGHFYNYAAKVAGAYGGVTSFNNNPPHVASKGASADHGVYFNYGAREGEQGGGGHVEFSAKYGSPTAANACIVNYGSSIKNRSSAGHTVFSVNLPCDYTPGAGNAVLWNHPGNGEGAAGFTEFSVYGSGNEDHPAPTADNATLFNLGACESNAAGGYTVFSGTSTAANATLVAYAGIHGGYGGRILFYDQSVGGAAAVQLFGNGELDISNHKVGVTIGTLEVTGGMIAVRLGMQATPLTVSEQITLHSSHVYFSFRKQESGGFEVNTAYTVLTNANLSGFTPDQFCGDSIDGIEPTFRIVDNDLQVTFLRP